MPGCSAIVYPLFMGRLRRSHNEPIQLDTNSLTRRQYSPIHILNDDVLLNIFHLYRLAKPDEHEDENTSMVLKLKWGRQRWWYKLAHVCRQWRNVILGSPSRLDLHLYCTNGVPVADMLAHSPPLPLTVNYRYRYHRDLTAEDESGILLALSHRDRVRRICFWKLFDVGQFARVMDDRFPLLERIYIHSRTETDLPVTFQAPNLRHIRMWMASLPIGSPLLTTTAGLVTLTLHDIGALAYFPPSYILTRLSLMAQLEGLTITFQSGVIPDRDDERQPENIIQVTLPNLRRFMFEGASSYLEGLVSRISSPSLSTLDLAFFFQPSVTVPCLLQFIQTSENLRFTAVQVTFTVLAIYLGAVSWQWDGPSVPAFRIKYRYRDWQFASAVQFFSTLSPILSAVEHVTFSFLPDNESAEWNDNVNLNPWRELLRLFINVKTIHVQDGLVGKLFRSFIPSDDGEQPPELLPNLEEVGYSGGSDARDTLTTFLNERQVAGHPVNLRLVDRPLSIYDNRGMLIDEIATTRSN